MKTIGLLGGMSWESTLTYYKELNEGVKGKLGGLHSAKIVLNSVDFSVLEQWLCEENWQAIAETLSIAAKKVELAGADFLLICTNTMHNVASQIEANINIPILHIADATAEVILKQNIRTVGLLGTKFTMEEEFYQGRLSEKFKLNVLIPQQSDREMINQVVFNELCLGKIKDSSRQEYIRVIDELKNQGAEAIILGCTEIAMLVSREHTDIPLFDTTQIHAEKAVEMALY